MAEGTACDKQPQLRQVDMRRLLFQPDKGAAMRQYAAQPGISYDQLNPCS